MLSAVPAPGEERVIYPGLLEAEGLEPAGGLDVRRHPDLARVLGREHAAKAFVHTATYDVHVASWMGNVLADTSDGTGFPVIGPNGPTPDPSAARLLTYDQSGLMYDGGIIWRPSPRTSPCSRSSRTRTSAAFWSANAACG